MPSSGCVSQRPQTGGGRCVRREERRPRLPGRGMVVTRASGACLNLIPRCGSTDFFSVTSPINFGHLKRIALGAELQVVLIESLRKEQGILPLEFIESHI